MAEDVDAAASSTPGEGKAIAEGARAKGEQKVSFDTLRKEDIKGDIALEQMYARWMLGLMSAQIFIADVGFFFYGYGVAWQVDAAVMHVWLGSTVVEVIGVVFGISRYLFPRRDNQPGEAGTR